MNIQNRMSEATGRVDVYVRLDHIQRALKTIRWRILKDKPEIRPASEALEWMDAMSFDEIMLAATLVATVEQVLTTTKEAWQFIYQLALEGGMLVPEQKHVPEQKQERKTDRKTARRKTVAGSTNLASRQTD